MTLIQQQRLLGAVLLLCLIGVIAWFLLDTVERNQPQPQQEAPIAFDSVIEPIEERVEPVEEALVDPEQLGEIAAEIPEPLQPGTEQLAETEAPADTQPAPAPAPEPEPQQENKTESPTSTTASTVQPQWVLQLASFSKKQNADALNAQLEQLGHDPMIETVNSAGTLIYRVRLKPVSDRKKLEQTAKILSDKLKLNPQILQHQP